VAALRARSAYPDGEMVVLDETAVSSFILLQEARSEGRSDRTAYCAFDLPFLYGCDLRGLPLTALKEALAALLPSSEQGQVRYCKHFRSWAGLLPGGLPLQP
jgi:bifunctional non-homologous end joining protein LigD